MKAFNKQFIAILLFIITPFLAKAQKEALLIGTFHFHNPGQDLIKSKSFDITSTESQKELEYITDQIRKFHPDKIFVEWNNNDQKRLDSLYQLYTTNTYTAFVDSKYKGKSNYNFYTNNEIIQLGFRAAKKTGLKKVNAIDYEIGLPFDTVMKVINNSGQVSLMKEFNSTIEAVGKDFNEKISKLNLIQLLEDLNTSKSRQENNGFYIKLMNPAGPIGNYAGADAVAQWYKRNLYMYSLIQKNTEPKDQRIMILLGSGHVSMIKKFIEDENVFKVVELNDLLNKK